MSDPILIRGCTHQIENCITCGVIFTVPDSMWQHARSEGGYFHCPNGHSQGWSKERSEREQLRRERDRLKQDQARLADEVRAAEEAASLACARAEKAESANKRLKKRSAAGTCPCCARTFSNMAEHMKHQHPEFVCDSGAKVVPIKRQAARS
jgi:hypothetical protein